MFQGSFRETSRVFQEISKGIQIRLKGISRVFEKSSGTFQGNSSKIEGKFQGCFREVSKKFQGSFKSVSRKVQCVSREFSLGFKEFERNSMEFKGSFKCVKKVSRVFQKFY